MSTEDTSAAAAGAEDNAAVVTADTSNPADAGANTDDNAAEGENDDKGGEAGDDLANLDPRDIRKRFTSLSDLAREAQKAADEAKLESAKWQGIAEERARNQQTQTKAAPPPPPPNPNPKPDPNDKAKYPLGVDDPKFIGDTVRYEIKAEAAQEAADTARKNAVQADYTERRNNFLGAVEKAKANADTPNAAAHLGTLAPAIVDLVAVSEHSDLIAEHLHSKPELYQSLVKHVGENGRLTPKGIAEVSKQIGIFEATLPGQFAARKVTKAPTPPESAGGGGKASVGADPRQRTMTTEEYRSWRASGGE